MEPTVSRLENGAAVIRLDGRLNMVGAAPLRQAVASLVEQGHSRIAVDLSGVDFMDSSGLGALIAGLKTARQAGGDLRIAAPGEQVRLVLQLTNMERVLAPYETTEEALADA
jgi:anti-sigma B factor antagonist